MKRKRHTGPSSEAHVCRHSANIWLLLLFVCSKLAAANICAVEKGAAREHIQLWILYENGDFSLRRPPNLNRDRCEGAFKCIKNGAENSFWKLSRDQISRQSHGRDYASICFCASSSIQGRRGSLEKKLQQTKGLVNSGASANTTKMTIAMIKVVCVTRSHFSALQLTCYPAGEQTN